MQRKLESAIRHAKDRQTIAAAAGDDILRREEQAKLNMLSRKYKDFSDAAGLSTKAERAAVSGYHRVKSFDELKKPRDKIQDLGYKRIESSVDKRYNIDKDTIKRIEKDLKAVNPHDYRDNCQKCISAYEARRRGFDVTAKQTTENEKNIFSKMNAETGWLSVYKNPEIVHVDGKSAQELKDNIRDMMSGWGNGSRAAVRVKWNVAPKGHVFISEHIEGKTIFIDPEINDFDVERFFDHIELDKTYIIRIDNLEFTENIKRCCEGVDGNDNF